MLFQYSKLLPLLFIIFCLKFEFQYLLGEGRGENGRYCFAGSIFSTDKEAFSSIVQVLKHLLCHNVAWAEYKFLVNICAKKYPGFTLFYQRIYRNAVVEHELHLFFYVFVKVYNQRLQLQFPHFSSQRVIGTTRLCIMNLFDHRTCPDCSLGIWTEFYEMQTSEMLVESKTQSGSFHFIHLPDLAENHINQQLNMAYLNICKLAFELCYFIPQFISLIHTMNFGARISEQIEHDNEQSPSQAQNNSSPSSSQHKSPKQKRAKPNPNSNPNICSNKICQAYKPSKYNLSHQNNMQSLCPDCLRQYQKQSFCLYCKQIYFDFSDDGKQWIMCDECERWVHTECADFYPSNNTAIFNCLRCKKIEVTSAAAPNRRNGNATRNNSSKVPERRKTQECMLNNFGFYWQLSPAELAQDVEKLKQFLK